MFTGLSFRSIQVQFGTELNRIQLATETISTTQTLEMACP